MLFPLANVKSPASSANEKFRAMAKEPNGQYGKDESEERLVAALRGARITGHRPMSEVPKKTQGSPKKPDEKKKPNK